MAVISEEILLPAIEPVTSSDTDTSTSSELRVTSDCNCAVMVRTPTSAMNAVGTMILALRFSVPAVMSIVVLVIDAVIRELASRSMSSAWALA